MAATTPCPEGPQNPVFDTEKCDVPCIFPIPDESWLSDTVVPSAAPAIADCFPSAIPLPPPDPLCPTLTVAGGSGGFIPFQYTPSTSSSSSDDEPSAFAYFAITKTECCAFDFNLLLAIPCVRIIADNDYPIVSSSSSGFAPCGEPPQAELLVEKDPQNCQ